jgi:hypothetical protein
MIRKRQPVDDMGRAKEHTWRATAAGVDLLNDNRGLHVNRYDNNEEWTVQTSDERAKHHRICMNRFGQETAVGRSPHRK